MGNTRLETRRSFMKSFAAASIFLAFPTLMGWCQNRIHIPFLVRIRSILRHFPHSIQSKLGGSDSPLSDQVIQQDYANGHIHLVNGYFVSEAEILNLG